MGRQSNIRSASRRVSILTSGLIVSVGVLSSAAGQFWAEQGTPLSGLLVGLGASLIASIVVFLLVTLFITPRQQQEQTEALMARLDSDAPLRTFPASQAPKGRYRDAFVHCLVPSTRYDYSGGSATFTAFRLFTLKDRPAIQSLQEIRLNMVDPREVQIVDETARQQGKTSDEFRTETYVALSALYDAVGVVSRVYLSADPIGYRCELFDGGVFLTYYIGSARYQETHEYSDQSSHYLYYKAELERSRNRAMMVIEFGSNGGTSDLIRTEAELEELLTSLGCRESLDGLREQRAKRYASVLKEVRRFLRRNTDLF